MRKRNVISLSLLLTLAACATPIVDQNADRFDDTNYTSDLNFCRGGSIITASARSIGIALLGSAYGAIEGAHYGARSGDTTEGAVIGAAIGGTLGLAAGAVKALENHEAEIQGCLAQKGYRLTG